ncbi:MAG TPA: hypothetical protein VE131_04935, partial [Terriglobales bacterium]|nr:hypothetical protein [Terriglobales bacterium]
VRAKLGGPSLSDDELLLRYVAGTDEVEAMRAAHGPKQYASATKPLLALLQDLSRRKDTCYIYVEKGGLSVTLRKEAGSGS